MATTKINKGSRLTCSACGRKVIIDECGISDSTLWCCDKPMEKAATSSKKNKTSKGKKKK